MTIVEFAQFVLDHPEAVDVTETLPITQRLPALASEIDPAAEEAYWAKHYAAQPYISPGEDYSRFRAAYRHGWMARMRHPKAAWIDVAQELKTTWDIDPANFDFPWSRARSAVRDAWDRVASR